MSLLGEAAVFPLGAALSLAAVVWNRRGRLGWMAAAAVALFASSLGRHPLVAFFVIFAAPTVLLGAAVVARRGPASTFAAYAASDLLVAVGLWVHHSKTTLWTLPEDWGQASAFIVGAAVLRLGTFPGTDQEGADIALAGWWQGLFLAWWAAGAGAPLLAASSLAMAFMAAATGGGGATIGAALGLGLAAVSADPLLIAATGLAAMAFVIGERAVSLWTLAILPGSVVATALIVTDLPGWSIAFAALAPAALAALILAMMRTREDFAGGYLLSSIAVAAALWTSPPQGLLLWILYGGAATLAFIVFFTDPADLPSELLPLAEEPSPEPAVSRMIGLVAGGLCLAGAAALTGLLLYEGLRTGFL